jgi:nucleoside 2-deoxyribosyltransferase
VFKGEEIAPICEELGFTVLVPGGFWKPHTKGTPEEYFAVLLRHLENSDLVVVGLVPDLMAEAALAMGYAMARGKTIIAIKFGSHAPAILQECAYIVEDLKDLRQALYGLRPEAFSDA